MHYSYGAMSRQGMDVREGRRNKERQKEKLLFSKLNILSSFTFSSHNIYKTFEDIAL